MGVSCVVFDIDGMLFEFFIKFLNIEKKIVFFLILHLFFSFYAISNIKKNIFWCREGLNLCNFQHSQFFGGNIEKCPFTYWLNGRWFLQIVDSEPVFIYTKFCCYW